MTELGKHSTHSTNSILMCTYLWPQQDAAQQLLKAQVAYCEVFVGTYFGKVQVWVGRRAQRPDFKFFGFAIQGPLRPRSSRSCRKKVADLRM